jgi:hypothetical protein
MRLSVLGLVCALSLPGVAHGQTAEDGWAPPETAARSTSSEASILSGRTLGVGETMIAAGLGWPGFWAHIELAPSSIVNVGIRAAVLYGSAVMGLIEGAGGELSVPIRIHVFGEGDVDLALRIAPEITLGEGRLFGEQASPRLSADLGISSRLEVGVLLGWQVSPQITLIVAASASPGISFVDPDPVRPIGLFTGSIGIEALMTRETMLFAIAEGGGGVAESRVGVALYPAREIFRLSLGLGYLL